MDYKVAGKARGKSMKAAVTWKRYSEIRDGKTGTQPHTPRRRIRMRSPFANNDIALVAWSYDARKPSPLNIS